VIYVRRDPALIPDKVLRVAGRAQARLEALPPHERVSYIKSKSHVWRSFGRYLAKMSYGKCWYSESLDPQSFFDVDHFRPKAEATRASGEKDDGYPWLAFSWENFRYSSQRSNRHSHAEDTEEVVGKGSWFPLLDGSPVADWGDRCVLTERPVLLDPTVRSDVDLLAIGSDAMIGPSPVCIGSARRRVERSIELYGLNLPGLVAARKRVMREINAIYSNLMDVVAVGNGHPAAADELPVNRLVDQLRRTTYACSPYSRAARAKLIELGLPELCALPEDARADA
jgi:hypothetical protein